MPVSGVAMPCVLNASTANISLSDGRSSCLRDGARFAGRAAVDVRGLAQTQGLVHALEAVSEAWTRAATLRGDGESSAALRVPTAPDSVRMVRHGLPCPAPRHDTARLRHDAPHSPPRALPSPELDAVALHAAEALVFYAARARAVVARGGAELRL